MTERRDLILVGGGGHCKSVIEAAESAGFHIHGILDRPERLGQTILKSRIIGTDSDIPAYAGKYDFVVTIGFIKDLSLRLKIHDQIRIAGGRLATIIASTARVSKYAFVGEGTVILHQAVVNAGAQVGTGCIINTLANIEHDAVVGDYCHISTGVMVNGDCRVGARTFLGSRSIMVNGILIAEDCIIAAGSLVRKNILQKGIYSGAPAILMKRRD